MIEKCKQCGNSAEFLNLNDGRCPQCTEIDNNQNPTIKSEPKSKGQNRVYLSFIFIGLISLWASFLIMGELSASRGGTSGLPGVLGFGVSLPFGIPLLIAAILGPYTALLTMKDRSLNILSFLLLLSAFVLPLLPSLTWAPLLFAYGVACIILTLKKIQ